MSSVSTGFVGSTVFISYRQTDARQRERVRAFGERLLGCGIDVVLDQFFLDANPGGPDEGWDKWSSDRALSSERVLIVGTHDWFECFEKKQPPGTGLGAACEADDLRHRIYEAGGVIEGIRVMLFDDVDAAQIPGKLKRYHRFHAERDFVNIVRWLGGTLPREAGSTPHISIPHNLPSLQPFFGREEELRRIADALDPESRTWGALIDGPGGMGKTSLAVRAAYDVAPDAFEKIVFVSLKSRELDDDGVRDLSGFLISGLAELFNEIARELRHADITKSPEEQRPRLLIEALRGTKTLLVLDNLESLTKAERDVLFTFVKRLPQGCKAILTARGRIGSAAEELILQKLDEDAALATLAKLAETNPALEKTNEAERLTLYRETGGTPLLLRWTAGQIGRGSCLTFTDAIFFLRSCPKDNDPLDFVFGDLVEDFTVFETRMLCALTYFTLPAKVAEIAALAECSEADADSALRSLTNRSLVVPTEELKSFTLVPLVAHFLRKKKPEVVADTGNRLMKRAFALVLENGFTNHVNFPMLADTWPTVAAALPVFLSGPNQLLQDICEGLNHFCNYTGRWDELLALLHGAESRAIANEDYLNAGWQAYRSGLVYRARGQSAEDLACAERVEAHWADMPASSRERAIAIYMRGVRNTTQANYSEAIADLRQSVDIFRARIDDPDDVAICLNQLAATEKYSGDFDAAERHFGEALRISQNLRDDKGIALAMYNLADLARARLDWPSAEARGREALRVAETVGRLDLLAAVYLVLADSLLRTGRATEALPHAQRALDISTRLGFRNRADAQQTLDECMKQS
jgi:AAA ATPase domain/Tetratricopeptide repeat/SEFIR domain